MNKKKLALLALRKAALDRIEGIFNAAEASTEKRMSAEQTTEHAKLQDEIRGLDVQITALDEQIEARRQQEEMEKRAAGGGSSEPTPRSVAPEANLGLSAKELRDIQGYSYIRAFNACLHGQTLDGIEGEMNKHAENEYRAAKVDRGNGNLLVPQIVLRHAGGFGSMELRDNTATGSTSNPGDQGGLTIQTSVGSLIDRLRNALVMSKMGVTMMGGLQGNIDFPKVIADDAAAERAENATSAESSPTFSKVSLTPRRLPVFAEVSRQLLLQSSVDVEAWLRNDLAFQIAQVMDARAISGNGSGQPYGILNTVGVGALALGADGAAPDWATVVDLETLVASLNADVGSLGYILNTKTRGKFKKTPKMANTITQPIWDGGDTTPLNGYKVGVTNLVPSNLTKGAGVNLSAAAFGNFNDALMGQWGGLEFLINPYSKDTEGLIRINCWTFYDFIVRRVESFAVCKDIVTL